jgi:DNA-binding NarL/FixJ family response regulator
MNQQRPAEAGDSAQDRAREPITVLLVDDHPLFREGLAGLLRTAADLLVVGQVAGGAEAVQMVEQEQPDVVVMDLEMPGLGGVAATRQITRTSPHVRVLILTMFDDDGRIFEAMRAGARGYLLKESDPTEVLDAVRSVARGEAIFGRALAGRLASWFTLSPPDPFSDLTPRERQALDLVARGLNNAAIAARLGISLKTVRNLVSNVLTKLQVADRAQAIVRARESGLGGR